MATEQTGRERGFAKEIKGALERLERSRLTRANYVYQTMAAYQREVVGILGQGDMTEWKEYRLQQVNQALLEAKARAEAQLMTGWATASEVEGQMAMDSVNKPLDALGLEASKIHGIPTTSIEVINNYVPELITNVTTETHQKVRGVIRQAMMGGIDGRQALAKIGATVGALNPGKKRPENTIFSSANVRARTIFRTEANRLHNVVKNNRTNTLAEKYPGVGQKWIHRDSPEPRANHARLHGEVVYPAEGGKFSVGGVLVDGPHDPALPAKEVINCHCGTTMVYDKEKGMEGAKDSPYIAGDGSDIPTVGMDTEKTEKTSPAPKKKKKPPLPAPPSPGASTEEHLEYQKNLVNRDLDGYPKPPPGASHYMGYETRSSSMVGKIGAVDLLYANAPDKDAAERVIRETSEQLHKLAVRCEERGIPAIRGVFYYDHENSGANMGDGILGLNTQVANNMQAMRVYQADPESWDVGNSADIVKHWSGERERVEKEFNRVKAKGEDTGDIEMVMEDVKGFEDRALDYQDRVQEWYDSNPYEPFPYAGNFRTFEEQTSMHTIGTRTTLTSGAVFNVTVPAPPLVTMYLPPDKINESIFDHEFGHHIHQVTPFARSGDVNDYDSQGSHTGRPIENDFGSVYYGGIPDHKYQASDYGRSSMAEWFAENYTAWSNGRTDLCDPKWKDFFHKWDLDQKGEPIDPSGYEAWERAEYLKNNPDERP